VSGPGTRIEHIKYYRLFSVVYLPLIEENK